MYVVHPSYVIRAGSRIEVIGKFPTIIDGLDDPDNKGIFKITPTVKSNITIIAKGGNKSAINYVYVPDDNPEILVTVNGWKLETTEYTDYAECISDNNKIEFINRQLSFPSLDNVILTAFVTPQHLLFGSDFAVLVIIKNNYYHYRFNIENIQAK